MKVPFQRRTSDKDWDANKYLKIISWNVNGLNSLLKGDSFDQLLKQEQPDVLCLQETKLQVGAASSVGVCYSSVVHCFGGQSNWLQGINLETWPCLMYCFRRAQCNVQMVW